ncbi:ornithine decarboxylase [Novymonas esmeraldas]|uniref:ornithine decarboxylase n=1 Tax=Novymonas esmeraldas TaxID=1808958 RepID=A0AAW0F325_9TRYP
MSTHHDTALCHVSHYHDANYGQHVPLPTAGHHHTSDDVLSRANATALDGEAAHHRRLARKAQLLEQYRTYPQSVSHDPLSRARAAAAARCRDDAAQLADADSSQSPHPQQAMMFTPTDCNKQSPAYAHEVVGGRGDDVAVCDPHAPAAATQDLVDMFLLEGSAEVGGRCLSPYPIYGPRTAEQRRDALRDVFERYGVTTHLPASSAALAAAQRHHDRRHPGPAAAAGHARPTHASETREQYWRRLSHLYIQKGVKAAAAAADATAAYEPEDPFYMIDLGRVVEQMARWRRELPMVRPHFAVKCNPNVAIMEVLAALGAGFDCASKEEIRLVLDNHLVESPDDIIFANPCKQLGDLRAAQECGVTYVTVDNVPEMEKIGRLMPSARAVIRIKTNDGKAKCAFSTKFGAGLEEAEGLLRAARRCGVEVYGVSFHVGSGNGDQSAYVSALRDAHHVFKLAARHGFNCTVLDIGGGYPGTEAHEAAGETSFESIARAMRPVLEELFGGGDVTIISEPGRYFTAATHALAMNVFATRTLRLSDADKASCQAAQSVVPMDEPEEYQYYVNDGLYHSFNCIVFDHAHPTLLLLNDGDGADAVEGETALGGGAAADDSLLLSAWDRRRRLAARPLRITTIFGPTADSMDCILKKQPFPEMRLGDWLLVPDMGSYTTAAGCPFNGFATRRREWVSSIAL